MNSSNLSTSRWYAIAFTPEAKLEAEKRDRVDFASIADHGYMDHSGLLWFRVGASRDVALIHGSSSIRASTPARYGSSVLIERDCQDIYETWSVHKIRVEGFQFPEHFPKEVRHLSLVQVGYCEDVFSRYSYRLIRSRLLVGAIPETVEVSHDSL